jgi:beta-glucoside operon transcriptional antiterminator
MRIDKIINNNIVSAYDKDGKEVVLMGRGLGFETKKGQAIPMTKVEKIFRIDSQKSFDKFKALLVSLPLEHIQLSSDIIAYAAETLNKKLNQNIYITLTDHISFAIERHKKDISFPNAILWEIKRFYQDEYKIGKYAVELINNRMRTKFQDDEAGFIALHIVNAEYDANMMETMDVTKLIQNVIDIVKNYFQIEIDEDTLHFERFVTHIKYLAQRILKGQLLKGDDAGFTKMFQIKYPEDYECGVKIADYIETEYKHKVTDEELLYLTVHINRVRTCEN